EIRIRCEYRHEFRSRLPSDFAARRGLPTPWTLSVEFLCLSNSIRRELHPLALLQVTHARQSARPTEVVERGVQCRGRPTQSHSFARHIPFKIQSPLLQTSRKTQCPRGDHHLGGPAVSCSRGSSVPDTVPIERDALRIRNESVRARPGRVDLKKVSRAAISIGIQNDAHRIVALRLPILPHRFIPPHGMDRNLSGMGISASEAKVDAVPRYDDAHCGLVRRRGPRLRRLLHQPQLRRFAPNRFVQPAIQHNGGPRSDQGLRFGSVRVCSFANSCRQQEKQRRPNAFPALARHAWLSGFSHLGWPSSGGRTFRNEKYSSRSYTIFSPPAVRATPVSPPAADRSSAGTTAMVYDCLVGTSIWLMLNRNRRTVTASESVGMSGTRISSRFEGRCVTTMVRTSPIRAAIRDAASADTPANTFAQKKIAPRIAGRTPNRR